MKVLQTILGLSASYGGITTCTYDLLSVLHREGDVVDLLASDFPDNIGGGEAWIKTAPNDCKTPYAYSSHIKHWLQASDYDIYHTNGLWLYVNHETCAVARQKGKPYVITTHGMLYPDALRRSYWKKWPLLKLCFEKDILNADCIHVTCLPEKEHVRAFGYKGPIAVIPNVAKLPVYLEEIRALKASFLGCNRPRKLGFLGRLHPIKKVENLLYGMALLDQPDTELIIMGKGDVAYEQFLRNEAKRLHLKVAFHGFVSGRQKYEELAKLSCLFVPSDFENFGMIITEALSVGTPVMASLGTPWADLNTAGCGWWIDRAPECIAQVMREVLSMPTQQLHDMGQKGIQLVQEKYTADIVASKMLDLYRWLNDVISKPDFVYED